MRKILRLAVVLVVLGVGFVGLSRMLTTNPDAFPVDATNPLPDCPSSPNCVRTTQTFDLDAETLFRQVGEALTAMAPANLQTRESDRRYDAVFRAFIFKDDVAVVITPGASGGSAVHVRSASRVGYSDLGVNGRRVRRFFATLDEILQP